MLFFKYIKIVIVGPVITEKSSNENALNRCFHFPKFSVKYVSFNLMNSHVLLGLGQHILCI